VAEPLPSGERSGVARAIVELGRTLEMRVVAEGIEAPDQAQWLMTLGCAYGQGYLYSRPLSVDAMEAFLAADATRRARLDETRDFEARPQALAQRQPRQLRLVSGE
jgi:sensor c-di-GMP phosphodiesterase-like protein